MFIFISTIINVTLQLGLVLVFGTVDFPVYAALENFEGL